MANLGLPVPPGFTITTEVCTHYYANGNYYPKDLERQVAAGLAHIARIAGRISATGQTRCWSRCAPAPAPRCPA